ncbi:MAG: SGNH/GDSL hydrolase family protein [Hyphomicrobiaceae bacterium]
MSVRLRRIGGNLALLAMSLAVVFAMLELVVFKYIFVPDDVLETVSVDGVVRYRPGTTAIMRYPGGVRTRVTINAQGWNSTKASYRKERTPGTLRVAVVGDSYVHARYLDVDGAFPELLEAELGRRGIPTEVYRFGIDGAPLSQYLHMLRREVRQYRPDIVVVPLIHNDFDESYRLIRRRYWSSFMKLRSDADGRIVEIAPTDYRPGLSDTLRGLRSFRYLYYNTSLYLTLKGVVSRYVWGGKEDYAPEFIQSAVDIRNIRDHAKNRIFARYVLAEMKRLADADGFRLAFVMDGVREAIYDGKPLSSYEVGKLNALAAQLTGELGLPFVDLQDTFAAAYRQTGERLEFPYDWHWNGKANALVARTIADMVIRDPRIGTAHLAKGRTPRL